MRVIVNQSTALGAKTGIGHYTSQLLRGMRSLAPASTFDAFPPRWWGSVSRVARSLRPSKGGGNACSWKSTLMHPLRTLSERALTGYLQLATRWNPYDLYHEPNYIPLPVSLPTVATVHDLSVLLHPQWHPADRVAFYDRYLVQGLNQCRHLLAVSEFTRQELIRVLHIPAERITCTPLGARPDLHPLPLEQIAGAVSRLSLPQRYLLFVGTLEPRKNPLLLMRAYCDLPTGVRERCPLVMAGAWGWNAGEFADFYHNEARHRGVVHRGYVPDKDLAALYGAARALVFPSHYEGFGLPPLEMMACGGAVIASTAGSVVEIVGRQAHLVAPDDFAGWRNAMQRVILDDDWQRGLCSGATKLAQTFSWERCARQTLQVYRSIQGSATLEVAPFRRRAG